MLSLNETISKKHIKISAYNSLIESKINSLPVDPVVAIKSRGDARLFGLTFYRHYGWDEKDFQKAFGAYGAAIYSESTKKYFITYNDEIPKPYVRWTLSSLLAAIELDLVDNTKYFSVTYRDSDDPDLFAQYFTAPDVILHSINTTHPEEIMEYCNIPFDKAYRKSQSLKFSWANKKPMIDKILRFVFDDYIESHKK